MTDLIEKINEGLTEAELGFIHDMIWLELFGPTDCRGLAEQFVGDEDALR